MNAERTDWRLVWLCIGAGIVGALQIGKAPPVILDIERDLGLTKVEAGWAISLISAVGVTLAPFIGILTGMHGARRVHLAGYLIIAAGSLLGMSAAGAGSLFAGRIFESLGFLAVIVAVPPMLQRASTATDQHRVMAYWGGYMPVGMVIALVTAPLIADLVGWRGLWGVIIAVTLTWGLLMMVRLPADAARGGPPPDRRAVFATFRRPAVWLLPAVFCVYNIQWMSVMGWLPSVLEDGFGLTGQAAALLTALPIAVNATINMIAGRLMQAGMPRWWLMAFASSVMALSALGIFNEGLDAGLRYALVVAFGGFGGLIPASLFALAPRTVARNEQLGVVNGLLVQGSHAGQLAGPPLAAAIAIAFGGWNASLWLMLGAAAVTMSLIAIVRVMERRTA